MTTTADPGHVITDREIGAAELQVTLDPIEGRQTPQWVLDLANTKVEPDRAGQRQISLNSTSSQGCRLLESLAEGSERS